MKLELASFERTIFLILLKPPLSYVAISLYDGPNNDKCLHVVIRRIL